MPRRRPRCETCDPKDKEDKKKTPRRRSRPASQPPAVRLRQKEVRVREPPSCPNELYMRELMIAILQAFKAAKALGLCSKVAIERLNLDFWFEGNPAMLALRAYIKDPGCYLQKNPQDLALFDQCSLLFDLWDMYMHPNLQVIQQVGLPPPPPPLPPSHSTVVVECPEPVKPVHCSKTVFVDCPPEPVELPLPRACSPVRTTVVVENPEPVKPVHCSKTVVVSEEPPRTTQVVVEEPTSSCDPCGPCPTQVVVEGLPKLPPATVIIDSPHPVTVDCPKTASPRCTETIVGSPHCLQSGSGCVDVCLDFSDESVGKRMLDCYLSRKACMQRKVLSERPAMVHASTPPWTAGTSEVVAHTVTQAAARKRFFLGRSVVVAACKGRAISQVFQCPSVIYSSGTA